MEDAQEEDRRAGTTRVAGTAGCAGLEAGRQWAPVRRMATDRCSGAQGRAAVYAGSARLRGTPASSWRPWAGRGSAHTAGMELRDKRRNEQLARSGAGTASCGRSGDQIELVYGVDRDGTLWPT